MTLKSGPMSKAINTESVSFPTAANAAHGHIIANVNPME
jgi:hypothetical protein